MRLINSEKRLEACVHAEGGHFQHLLWGCLPNIQVATYHNRLFLEPPSYQHLEENNIPSVRWPSSAFHKVVRWHYSGMAGKFTVTIKFVLFWDNAYMCVLVVLLKMAFSISQDVK